MFVCNVRFQLSCKKIFSRNIHFQARGQLLPLKTTYGAGEKCVLDIELDVYNVITEKFFPLPMKCPHLVPEAYGFSIPQEAYGCVFSLAADLKKDFKLFKKYVEQNPEWGTFEDLKTDHLQFGAGHCLKDYYYILSLVDGKYHMEENPDISESITKLQR